jgi:hypothetical protein
MFWWGVVSVGARHVPVCNERIAYLAVKTMLVEEIGQRPLR